MPNSKTKRTKSNKVESKEIKKANGIDSNEIKKWIGELTEISLLLIAFGIVIEILFGSKAPLGSGIMLNLVEMIRTLGENGIIGLAVLGIVVYLFRRTKVFA